MITGEQFIRYTQALEDARKRGIENLGVKAVHLEETASIPQIMDAINQITRDYGIGSNPEFQDFNDELAFLSNLSTGYIDSFTTNTVNSASVGIIQQEDSELVPNSDPVHYTASDVAIIDEILEKLI